MLGKATVGAELNTFGRFEIDLRRTADSHSFKYKKTDEIVSAHAEEPLWMARRSMAESFGRKERVSLTLLTPQCLCNKIRFKIITIFIYIIGTYFLLIN